MTTEREQLSFGEYSSYREAEGQFTADGFQDPTGMFPRAPYHFSSSVNRTATGGQVNGLYMGGSTEGLSLGIPDPGPSQYPLNQVQETASGHIIEIDDTPGNERILIRHNTGAGIELSNQGDVSVVSRNNRVDIVGADHNVIVEGEGNLVYRGNLNLQVTGDFNIECLNFNVNARGNRSENIQGASSTYVGSNSRRSVGGAESLAVAGATTYTFLGNYSSSVNGNYGLNVDGDNSQFASGTTNLTSDGINLSSNSANIAASSLSVFGATGTIGGDGIIMYNHNMYTGHTVYAGDTVSTHTVDASYVGATYAVAATFDGNLEGVAKFAAGSAAYSGPTTVAARSNDTAASALPTVENITAYLQRSANGIRRVFVDVGNFIRNSINRSEDYGGVSATTMTPERVRSSLRDPANAGNSQFVGTALGENILGPSYSVPAPGGIGRVVSGPSTPHFGQNTIGNASITSAGDPFLPRDGSANILPDPRYNPDFVETITLRTRLAPGVQLAKFFGTADPTPLDFIRDITSLMALARQLYLHAEVIRSIQNNEADFANFRLNVVEGVYRPGPDEEITAGSINELKLKGRAVVYSLTDSNGVHDNSMMFDLAEYWKDTLYFEKLILAYDTYGPDEEIKAYIILIMPEISSDWVGLFAGDVETTYNGNVVSQGELVECIGDPFAAPTTPSEPSGEFVPNGENGRLPPSALSPLTGPGGGQLRHDAAADWNRLAAAAARDGVTITSSSTYRTYQTQLQLWNNSTRPLATRSNWVARPGYSNHGWGIAVDVGEIYGHSASSAQNVAAYRWLTTNAGRFNFYQRMTWEPWHWEYTINNPYR